MINKIGTENDSINSRYYSHSNDNKGNPNFRGGFLPVLLQGVQACEQNPMINVAVIDMFSAILPRTFVESLTNWYAGFEAFRRESSGLIVNCMIPSVITLGIAKLLNGAIMPKHTNMAGCWADSNMVNKFSEMYEKSAASDKVQDTLKKILGNIEGFEGKNKVIFKDVLSESELDNLSKRLRDLTQEDLSRKKLKKELEKISDEIVEKTKVHENIKVNGGAPVKANTLDNLLKDSVKFFKEYEKGGKNLSMAEFAGKSKKLVRTKSLLGLAVILPLAGSMQFINRWITGKTSGVKGAPIYNDFGQDDAIKKSKEGLLKQKIISMSSMLAVGLLSMMKMPSINMLEFKGIFPTMDQARIISTTTFMSRMAAADDKHELAEATGRDIATFLSLYFLGDYAAKAAASILERKKGIKLLNDTKPLDKDANIFKKAWHWFKHVNVKSSKEVASKAAEGLKAKGASAEEIKKGVFNAKLYRSACQVANLGVSLVLLGLVIPILLRKNTAKKHAEDKKQALSENSPDNTVKNLTIAA